MVTHPCVLAWRIPPEEPGRLQSKSFKESDTTKAIQHAHMISEIYFSVVSTEACFFPNLSSNDKRGTVTYYIAVSLLLQQFTFSGRTDMKSGKKPHSGLDFDFQAQSQM